MSDFPRFLEELRSRINITELVGRRVSLTRKGRDNWGCCPFHGEKTPSFKVSEERGNYHCFGCHAHGDAIKFVMEMENLSFYEAVKQLAESAGLELPQQTPETKRRIEKQKSLIDVLEATTGFYEASLRSDEGKEALDYLLKKRQLSWETIEKFRLGYAPDSTGLYNALHKQKITDTQMVEAGLFKKYDGQSKMYSYLRNRIVFPIQNRKGSVIGFSGRILGAGEPKYLNTPETALFHKRSTLYGLYQSRENAYKQNQTILTEGQVDVITLHQAGFNTAMAPLGTAVTEDHLRLLWKMSDTPILCFDGDNAGKKAAVRAVERALPLLQSGKSLKVSFLPDGLDPDDLLKQANGKEKLNGLLKNARSLSEVLWQEGLKTRETSSPEHQAGLEKELTEKYNQIQDPVLKMHLIRDLKSKLWNAFRQRKTVQQKRTIAFSGSEEKKFIELLALYPNLFLEWEERILHLIDNKIIQKCLNKLANRQPLLEEEKIEIQKYQTLKLLSISEKEVKEQLQKLIDHQSIKGLEEERNSLKKQFIETASREDWELIQELEKEIQKLKEQNESM